MTCLIRLGLFYTVAALCGIIVGDADYPAGLRKLSSLSGVPIRCESDIERAYMAWRERQVAIDVP